MEVGYRKSGGLKKPYFKLFRESKAKVKMVQQLRDSLPIDFLNASSTNSFGDFRQNFTTTIVELKVNGKLNTWYFSDPFFMSDPKLHELRNYVGKIFAVSSELEKD